MIRYLQRIVVIGMLSMAYVLAVCMPVLGSDHPILYLFWGDGCPHCDDEKEFLEIVKHDYPQVEMRLFEVWNHPEFAKLADAMRKAYDITTASVPMTFLGTWSHVGFSSFETTGVEMIRQIEQCLQQGCPDALDRIGPQKITAKIRAEVARNAPEGWELHPAAPVGDESSQGTPPATTPPTTTIMVYYFYGNSRCPSCITVEQYTEEAVLEAFTAEIRSGLVEFRGVNVETPDTKHFIKDYQLYTKSVIVSEVVNGQEQRWKNLEKVWELLHNEQAFKDYVQQEIATYLPEQTS